MSGPRIGELCAGYGGLGMGVTAAIGGEVAWVSDIDKGANKVLAHRFPDAPNLGDMTTLDWTQVQPVDVICGGTPCQALSHAGKRAGMTEGTRSNLWVAMRDAIATIKPSLVVWENVGGAYSAGATSELEQREGLLGAGPGRPALRALGRVLGDLASLGYDAGWCGLRAADVGAAHGRLRVFVVAWPADAAGNPRGLGDRDDGSAAHGDCGGRISLRGVDSLERDVDRRDCADGPWSATEPPSLLPTPAAQEPGGTPEQYHARLAAHDGRTSTFLPLSMAVQLLPTPALADIQGGRKSRSGERSNELLLNGIAATQAWGQYTPAIARAEAVFGPAPVPTEAGPRGNPRLSCHFDEWLMGLPAGWITDVPDITHAETLRLCGNGVVPRQAEVAIRTVLAQRQAVAA